MSAETAAVPVTKENTASLIAMADHLLEPVLVAPDGRFRRLRAVRVEGGPEHGARRHLLGAVLEELEVPAALAGADDGGGLAGARRLDGHRQVLPGHSRAHRHALAHTRQQALAGGAGGAL